MTGDGDIPTSVQAIKAGAEDFLTKPIAKERLLKAIERALLHAEEMRKRGRQVAALGFLVSQLTAREHEIFIMLARGWPHKKIAQSFGTSERTIKFHRHNVMQKLAVHSLAEIAVIAEPRRIGNLELSAKCFGVYPIAVPRGYDVGRLSSTWPQAAPWLLDRHSDVIR